MVPGTGFPARGPSGADFRSPGTPEKHGIGHERGRAATVRAETLHARSHGVQDACGTPNGPFSRKIRGKMARPRVWGPRALGVWVLRVGAALRCSSSAAGYPCDEISGAIPTCFVAHLAILATFRTSQEPCGVPRSVPSTGRLWSTPGVNRGPMGPHGPGAPKPRKPPFWARLRVLLAR